MQFLGGKKTLYFESESILSPFFFLQTTYLCLTKQILKLYAFFCKFLLKLEIRAIIVIQVPVKHVGGNTVKEMPEYSGGISCFMIFKAKIIFKEFSLSKYVIFHWQIAYLP